MKLLTKTSFAGLDINNRIVRSATAGFMAENGYVSNRVKKVYKDLAEGNVGLIIFEDTNVGEIDVASHHLMINTDSHIAGLKDVVDIIHNNNSKTIIQLSHSGNFLSEDKVIDASENFDEDVLDKPAIKKIVRLFAEGALRAQRAGFDGVQIHCAHGYFITKFLSPFFNKRKDEYGGNTENRTRIIVEILREIKLVCGSDFPVIMKLSSSDFMKEENSNTITEGVEIAQIMEKAGIDAIEVSGGVFYGEYSCARNKIFKPENEAYHLDNALKISEKVSVPLILVGGMRSPEVINNILENHPQIIAVSLSRPLLSEPPLVKRWSQGDTKKARCVSCNKCFNPEGARCIMN